MLYFSKKQKLGKVYQGQVKSKLTETKVEQTKTTGKWKKRLTENQNPEESKVSLLYCASIVGIILFGTNQKYNRKM